ncbi:MAG: hypothetical protein J6T30_08105 [Bacteroidales bacterium]|nr:hypothetical protein [Bacteroidales bacterium]
MKSSKRVYISIVYILLSCLTLSAETPYLFGHSAIGNGMGKTGLTYPGISQAFNNQALLSDIKKLSFAANYESRFNLKELATKTLSIAIPAGNVTLGTKYSHFGYSDYSRSFVGLAAGIKLSKDFSAGVEIDYINEHSFDEYNDNHAITFEIGMLAHLTSNTDIGFHLFNPLPNALREKDIPIVMEVGIGHHLSSSLFITAEMSMVSEEKPIYKFGYDYEAVKNLWIRGGYVTENNSFCFGVGYKVKTVSFDLAIVTHDYLGLSSSASIIITL